MRFVVRTVQRAKLYRSGLSANDVIRRFNVPRPFLLLRVPILRHCDEFVTNFSGKVSALPGAGGGAADYGTLCSKWAIDAVVLVK
ncbi:hypothetical protein EVAR_40441_1 [Eumeta japonica]|uniref:Uncharacterized protein n=1 Tax=Eumeta variegata TaxID=151549 RepID=A0A4C1X016_EUMVA|nr:hypothetical protein EVAR_40441_1 [Eumeta japonica]